MKMYMMPLPTMPAKYLEVAKEGVQINDKIAAVAER